jgi:chemotaxis protein CheX
MLSKHQILEISQEIWESLLGMEIEASDEPASTAFSDCKRTMTGFVNIGGAWEGTVLLEVSDTLSQRFAATMLGMNEEVSFPDVADSLGELTNMVGGNIKSLLPAPSILSIPAVAEGSDYSIWAPGTDLLAQVTLRCDSEPMLITVRQANSL